MQYKRFYEQVSTQITQRTQRGTENIGNNMEDRIRDINKIIRCIMEDDKVL